jgi:CDP-glucose 4,6-dehydratase
MSAGIALVTGAEGFAGSWLCRALLEEGWEVVGYDRGRGAASGLELQGVAGEVEAVRGDVRDRERIEAALRDRRVARVFHLAAQTLVGEANASPRPTLETNVLGTWAVLEAARQAGTQTVVVASSDKAYGAHAELPYREDAPLRPTFPYDVSKAAADLIARSYAHTYGLPVAVTRFANIYGGGDLNFSRLIPEAAVAVAEGRAPVIRSDGSPERDYIHVEDAARAYLAIARAVEEGPGAGEAFNAGAGRPRSVREVLELIARVAGVELVPDFRGSGTPAGEIDRQFLDSTKVRELTGWRPQVSLEEGLRRTVEWYREHPAVGARAAAAPHVR